MERGGTIASMPDVLLLLIVILILAVVWRGPKTLPQIGNMLGRGVKATREEVKALRPEEPDTTGDESGPKPGA